MHVRIHRARERQPVPPVHHFSGRFRAQTRRDGGDTTAGDRDVRVLDGRVSRPDDADVLDQQVVGRVQDTYSSKSARLAWARVM
jgi:hypothetical protein